MLVVAVVVQLSSDALRRVFVPDLGGLAGVAIGLLWLPLLLGVLLWKLVIEPLRKEHQARIDQLRRQREELSSEAERLDFDARLLQALEMSDDEQYVFDVAERALAIAAPGRPAELLLADGDDPTLRRVATSTEAGAAGCPVARTGDCPAARQGRTLVFESSEDLAACPKLRNRGTEPIAATCAPVSVMGRSIGVVHATRPAGEPAVRPRTDRLSSLATRAGARIELIRALADSHHLAATDHQTGLANRRTLEMRYQELQDVPGPHGVLLCDLDHFKQLNDTHGHEVGDEAIAWFGDVLRRACRPEDLVTRFGGEEFVVLLPECDRTRAAEVAERIRRLLAESLQASPLPRFSVSIGAADTDLSDRLSTVVRAADTALYEAKRLGRDRVVVSASQGETGPPLDLDLPTLATPWD